jgi:hypothetical protein
VVWEPVLPTDWGTPGQALTSNIGDERARHFWDRPRKLSAMYGGAGKLDSLAARRLVGFQMKDTVWDVALVYPAGARWGAEASILAAPVVKYRDELARAIP